MVRRRVDGGRRKLRHRFSLHVAMLGSPFVVSLQQQDANRSDDRALVGKDADEIGMTLDFLFESLDRVRRVDLHPVLDRMFMSASTSPRSRR